MPRSWIVPAFKLAVALVIELVIARLIVKARCTCAGVSVMTTFHVPSACFLTVIVSSADPPGLLRTAVSPVTGMGMVWTATSGMLAETAANPGFPGNFAFSAGFERLHRTHQASRRLDQLVLRRRVDRERLGLLHVVGRKRIHERNRRRPRRRGSGLSGTAAAVAPPAGPVVGAVVGDVALASLTLALRFRASCR